MFQAKKDTMPVEFGVHSIRITNVGAIDDVTLKLENNSLLALYAGNGTGKTTLLECISLLGHLPCFPYIEVGKAPKPSRLQQLIDAEAQSTLRDYGGTFKFDELAVTGLTSWLETIRPKAGGRYGLVEFHVFDSQNVSHRFAIVVHAPDYPEETLQLTSILSRGEFDDVSLGAHKFNDDLLLSSCGFIVYDANHQQGQSFMKLLDKITAGRTFLIAETRDGVKIPSMRAFNTGVPPRSVTYINTDLNDFGRGNDLRESPKDLRKDFGQEMCQRMRIELSDGSFTHLTDLNRMVDGVISVPVSHFKYQDVLPPSFEISTLSLANDTPQIVVDRKDGTTPMPIGFMSAGENEIFFVFLMLMNFCRNEAVGKSIILLDEPDLHIANSSRSRYFSEILGLTQGSAQLIVSTHSAALFEHISTTFIKSESIVKVLFRRLISEEKREHQLFIEYDGLYLSKLRSTRETSKSPVQIVADWLHFLYIHQASRLSSSVPWDTFPAKQFVSGWLVATLIFGFFLIGAVANDAINTPDLPALLKPFFLNATDQEYHEKTRFFLLGAMGAFVVPMITVQFLRAKRNKDHIGLVRRFKGDGSVKPSRNVSLLSMFISFVLVFIPVFAWRGDFVIAGGSAAIFSVGMWLTRIIFPMKP